MHNPAQGTPAQFKVPTMPETYRYQPFKQPSTGGIIIPKETSEDMEELVEPVAAHGPKTKEEEQEREPPEPFEYSDDSEPEGLIVHLKKTVQAYIANAVRKFLLRPAVHCMYHCIGADLKNRVVKFLGEEKMYDYLEHSFTETGFQINILQSPDGQKKKIIFIPM